MKKIVAFPSSLFCICVDENTPISISARLFHCYEAQPLLIDEITKLLFEMELLFERINYPQPALIIRSFSNQKGTVQREETEMKMTEASIQSQKGKKATFVVRVTHRQNASWQGNIIWTEGNKSQNFRSALELLKLIDSALEINDAHSSQSKQTVSGI